MKNKKESKIRTRIILDRQKDDGNWENIGLVLCVSTTKEEALLQPLCFDVMLKNNPNYLIKSNIDFSDEYVALLQKTITELKDTIKKVRRLKND